MRVPPSGPYDAPMSVEHWHWCGSSPLGSFPGGEGLRALGEDAYLVLANVRSDEIGNRVAIQVGHGERTRIRSPLAAVRFPSALACREPEAHEGRRKDRSG